MAAPDRAGSDLARQNRRSVRRETSLAREEGLGCGGAVTLFQLGRGAARALMEIFAEAMKSREGRSGLPGSDEACLGGATQRGNFGRGG